MCLYWSTTAATTTTMKLTKTLDLPVPLTTVEYSHQFVMELKDPPVMVELGPGH